MSSLAFIIVLFAAVFHATWNFYTKKSVANKIVLLWAAQLLTGILLFPFAYYFSQGISSDVFEFFIITSIVHAIYVFLLGSAYELGGISVVYPISRGVGIAGTVAMATFIGIDSLTLIGFLGIGSILCGTIFIGSDKAKSLHSQQVFLISLLVGFSVAAYSVIDKMAMAHAPPFLFVCGLHVGSSFLLSFWVMAKKRNEALEVLSNHKLYAIGIGLAGLSTYGLILWVFQSSPASYVVALRETSILFATLLGVLVLKESFSRGKAIGVTLIVIGAVLVKFA